MAIAMSTQHIHIDVSSFTKERTLVELPGPDKSLMEQRRLQEEPKLCKFSHEGQQTTVEVRFWHVYCKIHYIITG